jgi:hypothetical protein
LFRTIFAFAQLADAIAAASSGSSTTTDREGSPLVKGPRLSNRSELVVIFFPVAAEQEVKETDAMGA